LLKLSGFLATIQSLFFSVLSNTPSILLLIMLSMLSACTVMPKPVTVTERYQEAQKNLAQLFGNEKGPITLTFEEALARGIRYNYDYRIKLVNSALQAGQLDIAVFAMFPDVKVTGSIYTRNNDYATFGITSTGAPTDVLTSTPRTLRSWRVGFAWNLLDLGMGYVRARQQGERVLIAQEESRKQLQLLAQDIRIAYWKAYSAQELLREVEAVQRTLKQTEGKMQAAIADKLVPKEQILKFRGALLGGDRQLVTLTQKLDKAILDLKHLLNIPLNSPMRLKAPPAFISRVQHIENLNFQKLDTISLIMRPELRSQNYMERIARFGVKAAILQVFPGITLNDGWNYNSNKFLMNNVWLDKSMDVSWGLLSLLSLPTNINTAKLQIKYEEMKSMALTLAVMTQTRYAFSQYVNLAREYWIADKQAQNAEALYQLAKNRNLVLMTSKQEMVYAKLQAMIAKMDRDLVLADLSTALGELYLSAGFDILPLHVYNRPMHEILAHIKSCFSIQSHQSFSEYVDVAYARIMGQIHIPPAPVSKYRVVVAKPKPEVNFLIGRKVCMASENTISKSFYAKRVYTLQLFGSYHKSDIEKMHGQLIKTSKNKKLYCGMTKFNGRDWYVLTYGKYVDPHQGKSGITDLPQQYRSKDAFVRNTQDLTWSNCGSQKSSALVAMKKLPVKDNHNVATIYKNAQDTHIAA
jgi:multidrug efflux system outer membrane protein